MSKKRGKLSNDEMDFIRTHAEKKTVVEIAEYLNRTTAPVEKFLKNQNIVSSEMNDEDAALSGLIDDLHSKPYWAEVLLQFTKKEVVYFEANWIRIVLQFREDLLYTEELQLKDLITLNILINRCLEEKKQHLEDKERMQTLLNKEYAKPDEERNFLEIGNLEQQVGIARASVGAFVTEYKNLLGESKAITKALKATREKRVKRIEDSKSSWIGHLRMLEEEGLRERSGIDLVVQVKAKDMAIEKLSEWHQYEDGTVDQPFLNFETVKNEDDIPDTR